MVHMRVATTVTFIVDYIHGCGAWIPLREDVLRLISCPGVCLRMAHILLHY